MLSPVGAQEIHGTRLPRRPPDVEMYSKPRSLSKPFVRFVIDLPSRAEMQDDVQFLVAPVADDHGEHVAARRRLDGQHRDVVRAVAVRDDVAAVVRRPLLVAERLEPFLHVAIELIVEVLRVDLQRLSVGASPPLSTLLRSENRNCRSPSLPHFSSMNSNAAWPIE